MSEEAKEEDVGTAAKKDINHGLAQNRRRRGTGKGLKGKGKGDRKGKGKGFTGDCFNCGQKGHKWTQCPCPNKGMGGYGTAKGSWMGSPGWPSVRSLDPPAVCTLGQSHRTKNR